MSEAPFRLTNVADVTQDHAS